MLQYQGQQCLNAFGCRRDEFIRRSHTQASTSSAAPAGSAGYRNCAAAEFRREHENQ